MSDAWSGYCRNIFNYCAYGQSSVCQCYKDYIALTKDNPKLGFEQWRDLIKIEIKGSNNDENQ